MRRWFPGAGYVRRFYQDVALILGWKACRHRLFQPPDRPAAAG
jgi:hypothetical protein